MPDQTIHPVSQAMAGGTHSLLARAYYRMKPYLPLGLRWAVRRFRTPSILRRNADSWPIDESSSGRPAHWPGWPDGRKFALVFTHDVESEHGLQNVRNLVELESRYGYRSSFNFIPEGTYEDPVELRHWLVGKGHEVGVHDLYHDGHLYESKDLFAEKADIINRYLKKWDAVGFRSGFMLRQLDWLHELNVLYDTSTFDTDPFEPQPEGSQTIFPFHVQPPPGVRGQGYIELSYTLPQDSTIFLLLREETPAIWLRKLDWIARNGGLALVNIHPDYIDFDNGKTCNERYPVRLLIEFLDYIKTHYADAYWNPLAKDLAYWYKDLHAASDNAARINTPETSR